MNKGVAILLCFVGMVECGMDAPAVEVFPKITAEKLVYESGEKIRLQLLHFAPPTPEGGMVVFYTVNDPFFRGKQPVRFGVAQARREADQITFPAPVVDRNALYRFVILMETSSGWQQGRLDLGIIHPAQKGSLTTLIRGGREVFLEGETAEIRVILKSAIEIEPIPLELRAQEFHEVSRGHWIAVGEPLKLGTCEAHPSPHTAQEYPFLLHTALLKPTRYELQAYAPSLGWTSNPCALEIVPAETLTHWPIPASGSFLKDLSAPPRRAGAADESPWRLQNFVDSLVQAHVNIYVESGTDAVERVLGSQPSSRARRVAVATNRKKDATGFLPRRSAQPFASRGVGKPIIDWGMDVLETSSESFGKNDDPRKILASDWRMPSEEIFMARGAPFIMPLPLQRFEEMLLRNRIGWTQTSVPSSPLTPEQSERLGDALLALQTTDDDFARVESGKAELSIRQGGLARYLFVTPRKAPQRIRVGFTQQPIALYDLQTRQRVTAPPTRRKGNAVKTAFEMELKEQRTYLFAALPQPIDRLEFVEGTTAGSFRVVALNQEGQVLESTVPVEWIVRDPTGAVRAHRFRVTGREESIKIAVNDRRGDWTVTAAELLSGCWVTGTFHVSPAFESVVAVAVGSVPRAQNSPPSRAANFADIINGAPRAINDQQDGILRQAAAESKTPPIHFESDKTRHGRADQSVSFRPTATLRNQRGLR